MGRSHVALARAVFGGRVGNEGKVEGVVGAVETAREVDERLGVGEIAFVTGPSGAGKTTVLREIARRLRARSHGAVWVVPEGLPDRAVVDCVGASFEVSMNLLAMCGLSDGLVLTCLPREVSTGQRWRLALAVGLASALRRVQRGRHATLLIDEFGSNVDSVAARCLCRTVRRFVMGRRIRAVCAGHDEMLMENLAPAVLVVQEFGLKASVARRVGSAGAGGEGGEGGRGGRA